MVSEFSSEVYKTSNIEIIKNCLLLKMKKKKEKNDAEN